LLGTWRKVKETGGNELAVLTKCMTVIMTVDRAAAAV
jgi:hypothetical protein